MLFASTSVDEKIGDLAQRGASKAWKGMKSAGRFIGGLF
jgi:hypothetical protein